MNLGQLLGEQKLRIWDLEDELAACGVGAASSAGRVEPARVARKGAEVARLVRPAGAVTTGGQSTRKHEPVVPPARGGYNRGVGKRVHEALPDHPPGETVSEIAALLGDISPSSVSAWVHHFDDILRTGEWGRYRYYRKAAA